MLNEEQGGCLIEEAFILSLHKELNADSSDEEIQDEDNGFRTISDLDVMANYKILTNLQKLFISMEFLQLLVVLRMQGLNEKC